MQVAHKTQWALQTLRLVYQASTCPKHRAIRIIWDPLVVCLAADSTLSQANPNSKCNFPVVLAPILLNNGSSNHNSSQQIKTCSQIWTWGKVTAQLLTLTTSFLVSKVTSPRPKLSPSNSLNSNLFRTASTCKGVKLRVLVPSRTTIVSICNRSNSPKLKVISRRSQTVRTRTMCGPRAAVYSTWMT